MPRATASEADQQLIAHAARHGATATARQLERWRAAGLLEPNIRHYPGRGRGSTSEPPPGAADLVVWLAGNERPGRRPGDLALLAFAEGLAVPEDTVRAAFASAITSIRLPAEVGMPPGSAPEDVADAAVAARPRFTMRAELVLWNGPAAHAAVRSRRVFMSRRNRPCKLTCSHCSGDRCARISGLIFMPPAASFFTAASM